MLEKGQLTHLHVYHKPILTQVIITYQTLMLIANTQGSFSLIAVGSVRSLPLQTLQCVNLVE